MTLFSTQIENMLQYMTEKGWTVICIRQAMTIHLTTLYDWLPTSAVCSPERMHSNKPSKENKKENHLFNHLSSIEIPFCELGPWLWTHPVYSLVAHSDIYWRLWGWGVCREKDGQRKMLSRKKYYQNIFFFSALSSACTSSSQTMTSTKKLASLFVAWEVKPGTKEITCCSLLSFLLRV